MKTFYVFEDHDRVNVHEIYDATTRLLQVSMERLDEAGVRRTLEQDIDEAILHLRKLKVSLKNALFFGESPEEAS